MTLRSRGRSAEAGQIVEQDIAPSWRDLDEASKAKWKAFAYQVKGWEPETEDEEACTRTPDGERLALVGVAIVGRPVAQRLDNGTAAEVTRLCTDGTRNACSMLYGAARRAARDLGHQPIYTYTLPDEGGASLRAAGFRLDKKDAGGSSAMWHSRPGRTAEPVGDDLVGGKWRWVG